MLALKVWGSVLALSALMSSPLTIAWCVDRGWEELWCRYCKELVSL